MSFLTVRPRPGSATASTRSVSHSRRGASGFPTDWIAARRKARSWRTDMAGPHASPIRLPILLLMFLLVLSALIGGIVARMLPSNQVDPGPRLLASASDNSLAPLVRKTAPAV